MHPMTSIYMCNSGHFIADLAAHNLICNNLSRWSARIIVDIGYGIDIGHDSSYVTLAQRVNGYFSLGVEPFRWLVDSFPFRAQFKLQIAP